MRRVGFLPCLLAVLAGGLGLAAAWHYRASGLALSHYDAKAHLVVARRVFDSITPGWEQVGAVWLPLPHLLNTLPAQVDVLYRTGAAAILLSVLSGAVTAAALAATVMRLTASPAGAVVAAAVFTMNPSVLYLLSTPMTEPVLFALISLEVLLATEWVAAGRLDRSRALGWTMVLACLTRYEAWPVTGAVLGLSAWAWWRRGESLETLARVYSHLVLFPAGAVIGFMAFSRVTVGEWLVSGGFFVPDTELQGRPWEVIARMSEGVEDLAGSVVVGSAKVATAMLVVAALIWRRRAALVLPLGLLGAAALPFAAFVAGHPFRVRYQIPLLVGAALIVGTATGLTKRAAPIVGAILLVLVWRQMDIFDPGSPMVLEAQSDLGAREGRRQVTACLAEQYRSETIMASMGALAHYMHELSAAGFDVGDFLHEGNHPMWDSAYTRGPAPLVGWVLVEERAEGGDALFQRAREFPRFLDGFERVCEGGNVALYRRR
ncbi:MAG: hypothetical protein ABR606_11740 [Vicinamibacterales bacterium]